MLWTVTDMIARTEEIILSQNCLARRTTDWTAFPAWKIIKYIAHPFKWLKINVATIDSAVLVEIG